MRAMKTIVLMCLCGVASVAPAKDSLKARLKAHAEQAVMAMLPTNAVNEAAGFFGPVTKKYLPEVPSRIQVGDEQVLRRRAVPAEGEGGVRGGEGDEDSREVRREEGGVSRDV